MMKYRLKYWPMTLFLCQMAFQQHMAKKVFPHTIALLSC